MNDDDWVIRALAEAGTPEMPVDVADRLDRVLSEAVADGRDTDVTDADVTDVTGTGVAGSVPPPAVPPPAVPPPAVPPAAVPPPAVPPAAVPPPAGDAVAGGAGLRATMAGSSTWTGGSGEGGRGRPGGVAGEDEDLGAPTPWSLGGDDELGERRRSRAVRWLPVAAGVLLLGGAGAVALQTLGGPDEEASTAAGAQEQAAVDGAAEAAETAAPRPLVATGTQYTTADTVGFAQQVRELVAVASTGADVAVPAAPEQSQAQDSSAADAPVDARAGVAGSPLLEQEAFDACIESVSDGANETVVAIDLAVVDGVEATVVVAPAPAGEDLFVYVVGPDCTGADGSQFAFIRVTP